LTTAKLLGLMVERKETGESGDFADLARAEILERIAAKHGSEVAQTLRAALDKKEDEPQVDIPDPTSAALN
jgi:hypothetical protein